MVNSNCRQSILNIYDVSGRIVLSTGSESEIKTIGIEKLRPGIYTLEIVKNKNSYYHKFSVIR
ncbi:MAG: T9SS type A sorting domain-containing protein [Bacteroidales bacterium]|nr:T9SS type A sorting domain-containing protein [Bacteroidales bacterium]